MVENSQLRFTLSQRIALAIAPRLAAFLLLALRRTLRFEVIIESGMEMPTPPATGVYCFWHRCLISSACYFYKRYKPVILISQSFDGELIAKTVKYFGFRSARGSSTRHGTSGLWALAKELEAGYPAVLTADGPRGPIYKAKPGAVTLSQRTGHAIGIFYSLPEKAWVLSSWDQFVIPKPFSRVVVSVGRYLEAPASADPETIEAKRLELEASLERLRINAERHFDAYDRQPIQPGYYGKDVGKRV